MFTVILGVALIFFAINDVTETVPPIEGTVNYWHHTPDGPVRERGVVVEPLARQKFQGVVRQAYDYSCGSAALTTVLNGYLGRNFQERQVMEGLLRFGEADRIVERRGFSLLDMKRLATALGHPSGGFRAEFEDLKSLDHPAIVPIGYAGFKHFVVVKGYRDGRVFVADPALGNISFTEARFAEVWTDNVLFIVFPNGFEPQTGLEITDNDLRYVDDLTISYLSSMPIPEYTFFMEREADEAGSSVKVLNGDEVLIVPLRTYFK